MCSLVAFRSPRALVLVAALPLILLAVLTVPAWSQDTLRLARLSGPVVIDGRVDEPAWERVTVLPLIMFGPQIVYNETLNTDWYSRTPIPPVSQGRAAMVKYTHTLIW